MVKRIYPHYVRRVYKSAVWACKRASILRDGVNRGRLMGHFITEEGYVVLERKAS